MQRLVIALALWLALCGASLAQNNSGGGFSLGGGGSGGGGTGACTTNTAVLFNSSNAIACDTGLEYLGSGTAGTLSIGTRANVSTFAAGRLGLSDSTTATEFDVFSTTDSTSGPTNSAYAYLKAGATSGEFDLGSTHTGSSTGLTKFGLQVDGTLKLDYGITNAAAWTLDGAQLWGGTINIANINNALGSITAFGISSATATVDFMVGQTNPLMQFGGVTSSFPAIRRNGAALEFKLADNSAFTSVSAANYQAGLVYAAAGTPLPTCNAGLLGTNAFVSDSTVSAYGTTYTSGGANNEPVFCNGANWIIGANDNDYLKDMA